MTFRETLKTKVSLWVGIVTIAGAISTAWMQLDFPTFAYSMEVQEMSKEQAQIAIDLYTFEEKDYRRQEIELRNQALVQENERVKRTLDEYANEVKELKDKSKKKKEMYMKRYMELEVKK